MRYLLIGRGRMGRCVRDAAAALGDQVEGMLGRDDLERLGRMGRTADVVVDFSRPEALAELCAYARRTATPVLSGTTGFTDRQLAQLRALGAHVPVLWSPNFSVGAAALFRAAEAAAGILGPGFDVEVTELHHRGKSDAPSGTALRLMRAADPAGRLHPVYGRRGECGRSRDEAGIHALRGGTAPGTHSVYFLGCGEELVLTHRALSRDIYAAGAVRAARALPGMAPGFYDLETVLLGG